jgi:hypothetical protein
MKHRAGDTVRIQTREWMDEQEKDDDGYIRRAAEPSITLDMQAYAGIVAKIRQAFTETYVLDIDDGACYWSDWMFDPDYCPDAEPLSAKDAVLALADGETLCDEDGATYWFSEADACFNTDSASGGTPEDSNYFYGLRRSPVKRKRPMSRWEIMAWASSEQSHGWLVRHDVSFPDWVVPQCPAYDDGISRFQRARLLPGSSGIDEDTIQGFEAEE